MLNGWPETDESKKMLIEQIHSFAQSEIAPKAKGNDETGTFPTDIVKQLGEMGLMGMMVPEGYGGAGMDAISAVIAHEEISYSDPGFCLAYLAHAMLCVNNLAVNGNSEQKKKYLPGLCSGELVGSMAMSEPNCGTDVLGMGTTAEKNGDSYKISGQKMWITNGCTDDQGTACDVTWLYARTGVDANKRPLISTFLIEKNDKGFKVGQKIKDKLGMRASNTAELVYDECVVPATRLVGKEGESSKHMMHNLEIERVTLAAMSLGIARRSIDAMNKYAHERTAFGQQINTFGQMQRHISESYAEYQAARAYIYNTARTLDLSGKGVRLDSDGVKLFTTTVAKNIADRAIQVMGGYGYVGEYVVERLWRDSKLLEIGGGTLEAHQKNITRDLAKLGKLPG